MNKNQLANIYNEIASCHICPKMDKIKSKRNIDAVTKATEVFIISQALASSQLRLSGVNFFKTDGQAGNTGKQLEKFLNLFGQTIYPDKDIFLSNDVKISKCSKDYTPVYNTEITQCFPGPGKVKGDRLPDDEEINNCLSKQFIFSELKIIKPKLLLLMGRLSIQTFNKYILKKIEKRSINDLLNEIIINNKIPDYDLFGFKVKVLPIQHASGVNPNYNKMLKNRSIIEIIRRSLDE